MPPHRNHRRSFRWFSSSLRSISSRSAVSPRTVACYCDALMLFLADIIDSAAVPVETHTLVRRKTEGSSRLSTRDF